MNSLKKVVITALVTSSLIINQASLANDYYFEDENSTNKTLLYGGLAIGAAGALAAAVATLIHSSNDDPDEDKQIGIPNIEANVIYFYEPGINGRKNLTIENLSSEKVSINSITFNDGAKNNINIVNDYCSPALAGGGSCNIVLEAQQSAYDGTVTIDYGYDNRQLTRKITIEKPSLTLYETTDEQHTEIPSDQEIIVKEEDPAKTQTFQWKNNGKFNWQQPYIKWEGKDPTGFELDVDSCGSKTSPGASVVPEGYCQFKITIDGATVGTIGKLNTSCLLDSLDMLYEKNVIMNNGISIVKNTNTDDYHLPYRSAKIINPTGGDIKLDSLDISINGTVVTESSPGVDKITYCPINSTDNPCFESYRTGSKCIAGQTLGADSECKIWFKAKPINDVDKLYHQENIPITITVKPNEGDTVETKLLANTDQALYIGGEFSYNNHATKWNGDSWVALGTGTDDNVYAIELRGDTGDIFVGGKFESPGKRAVIWNGSNWKTLSNSLTDGTVSDFNYYVNGTDRLMYVGGSFTSPANRIFRCDINNTCSEIPNTPLFNGDDAIYTIYFRNISEMFIGGNFSSGNSLKKCYISSNNWVSLEQGVTQNSDVLAISDPVDEESIDSAGVYFGGTFNYASGHHYPAFAVWSNFDNEWRMSERDPDFSDSDIVRAMEKLKITDALSYAYVAGGISDYNNIAQVRSEDGHWYSLGSGTDNDVYTITTLGNQYVYVAGNFSTPGNKVALWTEKVDGSGGTWSTIDNLDISESDQSIDGIVRDSAIAQSLKIEYDNT